MTIDKDLAREKFLKENPKYVVEEKVKKQTVAELRIQRRLERQIEREEKMRNLILSKQEMKEESELKKQEMRRKKLIQIMEYKEQGLNLRQIGEKLGVTRQRIDQIVHTQIPEAQRFLFQKKKTEIVKNNCKTCGKEMTYSSAYAGGKGRNYCSQKCRSVGMTKYKTPEERRVGLALYRKKRYAGSEEVRKRLRASVKKWLKKALKDPVYKAHHKKLQYEAVRRFHVKHKEEIRKKQREDYHKRREYYSQIQKKYRKLRKARKEAKNKGSSLSPTS